VQKMKCKKKKKFKKNGDSSIGPGVDPRLASDRWSPGGLGPPTVGRPSPCRVVHIFLNFFLRILGNGPRLLGEWVYSTPFFGSMPLHLELLNLPFVMEIGDFTFFQILFFLGLEYT
jgi:hypothetical protein